MGKSGALKRGVDWLDGFVSVLFSGGRNAAEINGRLICALRPDMVDNVRWVYIRFWAKSEWVAIKRSAFCRERPNSTIDAVLSAKPIFLFADWALESICCVFLDVIPRFKSVPVINLVLYRLPAETRQ